ncbi:MAG: hypothetical protein V4635_08500 [Bacteroidota bacterium]
MKKILMITIAGVFMMSSCKKDRTCTCTYSQILSTDNGVPQPVLGSFNNTQKLKKIKKNDAHCNSYESTETRSTVENGQPHTYVDVTRMDCKLD